MFKIEIKSTETKLVQGTSQKSGKAYSFHTQQAYAHVEGKAYPVEFRITLDNGAPSFSVGAYTIAPSSFYVDKFGNLSISPKLVKA